MKKITALLVAGRSVDVLGAVITTVGLKILRISGRKVTVAYLTSCTISKKLPVS